MSQNSGSTYDPRLNTGARDDKARTGLSQDSGSTYDPRLDTRRNGLSNNSGSTGGFDPNIINAVRFPITGDDVVGGAIALYRKADFDTAAKQVCDQMYFGDGDYTRHPIITITEVGDGSSQGSPQDSPKLLFAFRKNGQSLLVRGNSLLDPLQPPKILSTGEFKEGEFTAISDISGVVGGMVFTLRDGIIGYQAMSIPIKGFAFINNPSPTAHVQNDSENSYNPIKKWDYGNLYDGSYITLTGDDSMPAFELRVCYPNVSHISSYLCHICYNIESTNHTFYSLMMNKIGYHN